MNAPIIAYRANMGVQTTAPFLNTYSLEFDGVDDFVSCGDLSELGGQTEITISTWMKSTSSSNRILLDFKDGSSRITIQRASNSLMYLYVNNVNAQYSIFTALNNWYNIVYVFDGSGATNSDKLKLYVNGIEIIASSFSGTVPTSIGAFTSAMDSKIASLYDGTFGFRGNIDEVSVFDSAISIGDVWDGSGAPTDLSLLATPPLSWYRMGDNGSYKSPQWLIPNNENKDKVSNYSFDFDGVDDEVSTSGNNILNGGAELTVSVWMNTADKTKTQIITSTFFGSKYVEMSLISGGLYCWIGDGTSTSNYNVVNSAILAINNNTWYNFTMVFDGSQPTNDTRLKVYKDGALLTWTTVRTIPTTLATDLTLNTNIGARNGTNEFSGKIDEVAYWHSLENPLNIYNGGEPTTISGAVAHYKMGEEATFSGGVWTVPDSVGSNDGTSNAMTIEDRVGTAPSSSNNALSFNMDLVDRTTDVPT